MRLLSMLGASALLLAISIAVPAGKIPYSDISLDLPKVSEIEQHFETVKGMDKHGLSQAKHEYRQALYRLKRNLYTKHGINIPEEAKATAEKDFLQKFEKKAADFRAAREQLLAKLASQEREARESPSEAQLKLRLKDVKRRLAAAKAQRGRFRRRVQQSEGKIKGYESEVKEIETLLEYARKAGRTRKPDRAGDQEGGGPTEDKPMTFALPKSNSIHGPSGLVIDGLKGSALYGGYEAIKRIPGLAGFSLDKVLTF